MENNTVKICQPCFELVQSFGVMDWIAVAVLLVLALIFTFTKKNFFSFSESIVNGVQKGVTFLSDVKTKKDKPE